MLLSRDFHITQTGLSFSEIPQVFPAQHSSAQASHPLPAASWHHLETGTSWTSPAGSLDKASFAWQSDSFGEQKRGLPHARSPQNQACASIAVVVFSISPVSRWGHCRTTLCPEPRVWAAPSHASSAALASLAPFSTSSHERTLLICIDPLQCPELT